MEKTTTNDPGAKSTPTVTGPKSTSSDIYFVKIRPFNQNFKEAQSQGGGT